MIKAFLTGATGFIGSYIGAAVAEAGWELVCLKRKTSDLRRCAAFSTNAKWLDADSNWTEALIAQQPQVLIHAAWTGVTAAERDNESAQAANIGFFATLLDAAHAAGIKRIVALGSVAEYGQIDGRVDEDYACKPVSAYGRVKLECLEMLKKNSKFQTPNSRKTPNSKLQGDTAPCAKGVFDDQPPKGESMSEKEHSISYAWLRLFSTYGPGEGEQWLIPGVLKQMRSGLVPRLTPCEQRYDYLHVRDVAAGVLAAARGNASGVFNLGSNTSVPLKQIIGLLQEFSASAVEPAFGALPYRPNQSMRMEGDSSRFYAAFGFAPRISLEEGLRELAATG